MTQRKEITFSEVTGKLSKTVLKLKSKFKQIVLIGLIFGLFAFLYAVVTPVRYESKLIFSIQDSNEGYNGLASIAGQFGFDVGGQAGSNLFSSDNIIRFLTSESLIREVLLHKMDSSRDEIIANRYAEVTGRKDQWLKKLSLNGLEFDAIGSKTNNRLKDSLLQKVIINILKNELVVQKQDKKSSFVEVRVNMVDEELSQVFSQKLIDVATSRYLNSRLKIKILNLKRLEKKADSILLILNNESATSAALRQQMVDANPANKISFLNTEISERDKVLLSALYAEVIKNLELSRTLLTQETPVLEIVDNSTFPLKTIQINKYFAFIVSFFVTTILVSVYYLTRLWE